MKIVLFYESSADIRAKAPLHFPAHRARLDEFHARGVLLMVGLFRTREEGAMAVFTTRAAAEKFAQGDPFVLHGVVARWFARKWQEIYT
jgi:uncharacterized protein YciI